MSDLKVEKNAVAELILPSGILSETLAFFVDQLGFQRESIFPAEAPTEATLTGYGLHLRLCPNVESPGRIRLRVNNLFGVERRVLTAPNGTLIEVVGTEDARLAMPKLKPAFSIVAADVTEPPVTGRAGMVYRDLIPDRQGGAVIASHICVPAGGAVADWVHYHKIRFQLLYCCKGWARLVYEDQGEPFLFSAGDCIVQPPGIRHRVLETSAGFETIEVGSPALHETLADNDMALPTGRYLPNREYGDQLFLHHVGSKAAWIPYGDGSFQRQHTTVGNATRGLVDAFVLRSNGSENSEEFAQARDLTFNFVLTGSAILEWQGEYALKRGAAFVIPGGEAWAIHKSSKDFQMLQVLISTR
jgi:uncharacterized protein YjlB